MADHYYTEKPTAESDRGVVEANLRGKAFTFVTDAGVFSKRGLDFGSRLLIETMAIAPDDRVLDVGCGYGPIGLTAAWLAKQGEAVLVDINERAIGLAKENRRRNGIVNAEVLQSDRLLAVQDRSFTKILTNPPIRAGKQVVHSIFEQAHERLVEGGELWVVIQKKQGAPSAWTKLEEMFRGVELVEKDKGYWIIKAVK
ncbi:class I SAM-dependent methyltransferase [Paenibacillus sp. HJGM_3]|uniref:class I SAM-dependent methyltransferase n=1 Tax=Paenibacillus sp. HJGM_3 TaxID=3379816 RepID=UPI00385880C9